jgi:hypothetical protein
MHTCIQTSGRKATTPLASTPIHTTLYDLIAAVEDEVGPQADEAVTATVMHVLRTYRVTCLGNFEGSQMVCDEGAIAYSMTA